MTLQLSNWTSLYRGAARDFDPEEYLFADKAYRLERQIVTPYKEPASRQPTNGAFNYQLSTP